MKRCERIYVLVGVLAVLSGATFLLMHSEKKQEAIQKSGETVFSVEPDTVTALSWKNEKGSFSFHKDGNGVWQYDADADFPVDQDKIGNLLAQFEDFGAAFEIDDVEDYAQYGLSDPVCTVTLTTEGTDGKTASGSTASADGSDTYEISIGSFSKMDAQRYVSVGDGNAYLAAKDPYDSFDIALSGVIQNDRVPGFDSVSEIAFSGAENETIVYEENNTADTARSEDVYFTEQNGKKRPLDTELVEDYLHALSNLDLGNYVTYHVTDEELAQYGLDTPEFSVAVSYTDDGDEKSKTEESGTFTLSLSRDPKERAKAEKAAVKAEGGDTKAKDSADGESEDAEKITAYARVGTSPIVYEISGTAYQTLMKASYNDLRHKEILPAEYESITGMDVTLDGETYALSSEKKGKERVWSLEGEETDLKDLQEALTGLTATEFTDEVPDGKEEIRLTLHLDSETHPTAELRFCRYDGESCIAEVNGEPVAFVERAKVVALTEAVNAIVLN